MGTGILGEGGKGRLGGLDNFPSWPWSQRWKGCLWFPLGSGGEERRAVIRFAPLGGDSRSTVDKDPETRFLDYCPGPDVA